MENKIKEIESLLVEWEAAGSKAMEDGLQKKTAWFTAKTSALRAALAILTRPPNTQMHMDAKCYCETAIPGDWPCKVCMDEYYKTRR